MENKPKMSKTDQWRNSLFSFKNDVVAVLTVASKTYSKCNEQENS